MGLIILRENIVDVHYISLAFQWYVNVFCFKTGLLLFYSPPGSIKGILTFPLLVRKEQDCPFMNISTDTVRCKNT